MRLAVTMARVISLFVACLREVFDEAAYARFLQRHCRRSSVEAYAEFCREQSTATARRARCC